jgi:serine protease Do
MSENTESNMPEYEAVHTHVAENRNRPRLGAGIISLMVIGSLVLGVFGGMASFVVLANSKSPVIANVRHRLGIDANSKIGIPVSENIRLEESSAIIDAAKKVSPAVVSISVSQKVADFYGQVSSQEVAGGTGFILTSDGLIVTNKHVVAQQGSYKVILNDGRIFDATVKALDPLNDLAIVKIEAKDLPTVEIGNSDALQIGQYVIAVGNALGQFKNSVTLGVVSAKERSIQAGTDGASGASESLSGLLQTDASINPGNSGGPLVNLSGQVVGINTAIASTTGGSIGIGFAIPITSVKSVIDSVRKTGSIVRPFIGVRYVPIDKTLQQINNLPVDYGALVSQGQNPGDGAVLPGSPADKAGIVEGDIILEINGERITTGSSLSKLLQKYQPGDQVSLKILRKTQEKTLNVTLDKGK